ncbi:MAG: heavy-metal-associated domain-containing protein [Bacteroidota bacterium]
MKFIIAIVMLLGSICTQAQIRSASLTASGLTCSMCSKSIFKSLSKVPFVKSVDVNVEKSVFVVQFKENEKVDIDAVKKAVVDAGFAVAAMQVTASFDNAEVYNDAHVNVGGSTFHFLNVPKQKLTGDKTITIVDKNYLPAKERKQYAKYTKMKCFETGMMAPCCPKDAQVQNRVYHATL